MDAEDAFKQPSIFFLTIDGTSGKTDNNSSAPCDNAEKKTHQQK